MDSCNRILLLWSAQSTFHNWWKIAPILVPNEQAEYNWNTPATRDARGIYNIFYSQTGSLFQITFIFYIKMEPGSGRREQTVVCEVME